MLRPCLAAVSVASSLDSAVSSLTAHVCELLTAALEVVAVFGLDGVLDGRGHGVVCRQNGALDELDLTGHATLQAARSSDSTARLLTLSPGLGRAGLAPLVWRGGPVGGTKVSSGLIAAGRRVDIRAVMGLARILRRAVGRICLCQAVGRVWAVLRVAVEGVVVCACRILVQERAADLFLIVPARGVLSSLLASTVSPAGGLRAHAGRPRTSLLWESP